MFNGFTKINKSSLNSNKNSTSSFKNTKFKRVNKKVIHIKKSIDNASGSIQISNIRGIKSTHTLKKENMRYFIFN